MFTTDIAAESTSAANKAEVCNKQFGKYLLRSIMAGFYIVVATILSNVSAAVLFQTEAYRPFAKLLGALLFSIAIVLIVFIGGELFTGNNMTMAIGVYNRSVKVIDLIKVWIISYVGNFIGAFIFSSIFVFSNSQKSIMIDYYNSFMDGKLGATPLELLLRGILCNFMVCLAVWTGTRMKSESGKLIVMFCVIMTFVVSGFEHCIANMGTFSIGCLYGIEAMDAALIAKSMFFVTIGNILGGAVLLALPLKLMSGDK